MKNRHPSDHELRRRALELLRGDAKENRLLRRLIIGTALAVAFVVGFEILE